MVRREKLLEIPEAELPEEDRERAQKLRTLRAVPYNEVIAAWEFILEKTPFATKHGVRGLEFENILVVVGRGWNKYNFGQFLEWAGPAGHPADRKETFERNRNLFYICCSRAKKGWRYSLRKK
jgi:DNA helicase-2/ATP-dependent DNA helicase PcrA